MITEIIKELIAAYRRWHTKNRLASTLLLAAVGLIAAKIVWASVLMIASFFNTGGQRHAVVGVVTWQGKPLEVGVISFRPLEQQRFGSGATIQQGTFVVPSAKGLTPGKYKVRIHSSVADPSLPAPPPGERDTRPGVEILPQKYNATSELTVDIQKWGRTKVVFNLSP